MSQGMSGRSAALSSRNARLVWQTAHAQATGGLSLVFGGRARRDAELDNRAGAGQRLRPLPFRVHRRALAVGDEKDAPAVGTDGDIAIAVVRLEVSG